MSKTKKQETKEKQKKSSYELAIAMIVIIISVIGTIIICTTLDIKDKAAEDYSKINEIMKKVVEQETGKSYEELTTEEVNEYCNRLGYTEIKETIHDNKENATFGAIVQAFALLSIIVAMFILCDIIKEYQKLYKRETKKSNTLQKKKRDEKSKKKTKIVKWETVIMLLICILAVIAAGAYSFHVPFKMLENQQKECNQIVKVTREVVEQESGKSYNELTQAEKESYSEKFKYDELQELILNIVKRSIAAVWILIFIGILMFMLAIALTTLYIDLEKSDKKKETVRIRKSKKQKNSKKHNKQKEIEEQENNQEPKEIEYGNRTVFEPIEDLTDKFNDMYMADKSNTYKLESIFRERNEINKIHIEYNTDSVLNDYKIMICVNNINDKYVNQDIKMGLFSKSQEKVVASLEVHNLEEVIIMIKKDIKHIKDMYKQSDSIEEVDE